VLTGVVLGTLLLLGLFLLPPPVGGADLRPGVHHRRLGVGPDSAHCAARRRRASAYTLIVALALLFSWRWTDAPAHLLMLLGAACLWWVVAFFLAAAGAGAASSRGDPDLRVRGTGSGLRGPRPAADLRSWIYPRSAAGVVAGF